MAAANSPEYPSAQRSCEHLLLPLGFGNGLTPAHEAEMRAQALKFSQCARSHGMPNFPDPTSIGAIDLSAAGIDAESPAFLHAKQACRSLLHGFVFISTPG